MNSCAAGFSLPESRKERNEKKETLKVQWLASVQAACDIALGKVKKQLNTDKEYERTRNNS